jgi:hypothetical protein
MQSAYFGMAATPAHGYGSARAKDRAGALVVDALLRAGDVLLDIGTRDVSGVLAAAARVGPLGHVHVFEAPEAVAREAAEEVARLDLAQVTLHEFALSQANGHTQRFVAPLVAERPFGVRIDLDLAEAGVLASLAAFEHLRFIVAHSCGDAARMFEPFSAAGWTLLGIRRSALRCRVEPLGGAAPSLQQAPRDAVVVRLQGMPMPPSLHPQELARRLRD